MENIDFLNDELCSVSSTEEVFDISLYKNAEYFSSIENFVAFIKACEKMVRGSHEYSVYKAQLYSLGLTRCQFLSNIEMDEEEAVSIEMHHGPILTLFDYCAIITDALLKRNELVNTFIVTRLVIDEHFAGHVQTVMLSKSVHQLVDSGEIFINFNQATGNINEFLHKYRDGLNEERINKINRYIDLSKMYNSYDNGLLDLKNTITDWNYATAKARKQAESEE